MIAQLFAVSVHGRQKEVKASPKTLQRACLLCVRFGVQAFTLAWLLAGLAQRLAPSGVRRPARPAAQQQRQQQQQRRPGAARKGLLGTQQALANVLAWGHRRRGTQKRAAPADGIAPPAEHATPSSSTSAAAAGSAADAAAAASPRAAPSHTEQALLDDPDLRQHIRSMMQCSVGAAGAPLPGALDAGAGAALPEAQQMQAALVTLVRSLLQLHQLYSAMAKEAAAEEEGPAQGQEGPAPKQQADGPALNQAQVELHALPPAETIMPLAQAVVRAVLHMSRGAPPLVALPVPPGLSHAEAAAAAAAAAATLSPEASSALPPPHAAARSAGPDSTPPSASISSWAWAGGPPSASTSCTPPPPPPQQQPQGEAGSATPPHASPAARLRRRAAAASRAGPRASSSGGSHTPPSALRSPSPSCSGSAAGAAAAAHQQAGAGTWEFCWLMPPGITSTMAVTPCSSAAAAAARPAAAARHAAMPLLSEQRSFNNVLYDDAVASGGQDGDDDDGDDGAAAAAGRRRRRGQDEEAEGPAERGRRAQADGDGGAAEPHIKLVSMSSLTQRHSGGRWDGSKDGAAGEGLGAGGVLRMLHPADARVERLRAAERAWPGGHKQRRLSTPAVAFEQLSTSAMRRLLPGGGAAPGANPWLPCVAPPTGSAPTAATTAAAPLQRGASAAAPTVAPRRSGGASPRGQPAATAPQLQLAPSSDEAHRHPPGHAPDAGPLLDPAQAVRPDAGSAQHAIVPGAASPSSGADGTIGHTAQPLGQQRPPPETAPGLPPDGAPQPAPAAAARSSSGRRTPTPSRPEPLGSAAASPEEAARLGERAAALSPSPEWPLSPSPPPPPLGQAAPSRSGRRATLSAERSSAGGAWPTAEASDDIDGSDAWQVRLIPFPPSCLPPSLFTPQCLLLPSLLLRPRPPAALYSVCASQLRLPVALTLPPTAFACGAGLAGGAGRRRRHAQRPRRRARRPRWHAQRRQRVLALARRLAVGQALPQPHRRRAARQRRPGPRRPPPGQGHVRRRV